ncbi:MAG: TlpA family protein disulfide reductase [Acidobacteria bacterium]|nr:TlpA family protein disulfide reductase [Acidobacteriota bacterium]
MIRLLVLVLVTAVPVRAQTAPQRLEGRVVCCAECWVHADRDRVEFGTAEDLLRSKACVEGGDPTLLAVRDGKEFTMYRLREGRFRLPGRNWLEFVGRKVAVTGSVARSGNAAVFQVDTLEVLAPSPAERDAARVVGQEADLTLVDLFGATAALHQYRGRIVVLNFWATYCAPCREEMPDLAAIQNRYAALGVQVIGASADEPDARDSVLRYVRDIQINFPVWLGATTADMVRLGLGAALPGTVVIDRSGLIVSVISGPVQRTDLEELIHRMLQPDEASARRASVRPGRPAARKASSVPS